MVLRKRKSLPWRHSAVPRILSPQTIDNVGIRFISMVVDWEAIAAVLFPMAFPRVLVTQPHVVDYTLADWRIQPKATEVINGGK